MSDLPQLQRPGTLAVRAAEHLRELIASGRWPIGTKIPPEPELVRQLGVSRNTVREAVRALTHTGLLEARAGDGTYVRATSELRTALVRRSQSSEVTEVVELRAVLEEYAAGRAADRAKRRDVRRLRALLDEIPVAGVASMDALAEADARFHREVVALSGNQLLVEVYDHLGAALSAIVRRMEPNERLADEHDRWHTGLVDAIEAGDPLAAQHAASMLVAATRGAVLGSRGRRR